MSERRQSALEVTPSDEGVASRLSSDEVARTSDLEITTVPWSAVAELEPQALGITYRFDPPPTGTRCGVRVRFLGQRIGVAGRLGPRDAFNVVQELASVLPGSGPVTVTGRVVDIEPGDWRVRAEAEILTGGGRPPAWLLPKALGTGRTGFAPVVRVKAPGVVLGAWPALVLVGLVVGLLTQVVLARHLELPVLTTSMVSLGASLVGVIGGKVYFLAVHPDRQAAGLLMVGMAIQGFVLATVATLAAAATVLAIPLGTLLDATAPGLLLGMTIGRFGCFFGGCCAGRATSSRWGLWSSNRSIGVRRIPTQLIEVVLAGALGAVAFVLLWEVQPQPRGAVFVGALAAYTLGRQLLFPLRELSRKTAKGRGMVLTVSAVIVILDVMVVVVGQLL